MKEIGSTAIQIAIADHSEPSQRFMQILTKAMKHKISA